LGLFTIGLCYENQKKDGGRAEIKEKERKERRKTEKTKAGRKKEEWNERKENCVHLVDLLTSSACPFRYKFRAEIWPV
jgi:hypothetical protein